jgi:hypothetical protein
MEGIEGLVNCKFLVLYGNLIEFLEGLEFMNNLEELLLNKNRISNLNYLATVNAKNIIKRLSCAHNNVCRDELENIANLCLSMRSLLYLDLYGNEVASNPAYKFRLAENSNL